MRLTQEQKGAGENWEGETDEGYSKGRKMKEVIRVVGKSEVKGDFWPPQCSKEIDAYAEYYGLLYGKRIGHVINFNFNFLLQEKYKWDE